MAVARPGLAPQGVTLIEKWLARMYGPSVEFLGRSENTNDYVFVVDGAWLTLPAGELHVASSAQMLRIIDRAIARARRSDDDSADEGAVTWRDASPDTTPIA